MLVALLAPDALLDTTASIGVALHGREAIRGFLEDWIGAYEEIEWVPEEPLDLGNGVVFALVYEKRRPVGVTGYVEQRTVWVMVWVDGKIASQTVYLEADIDEARAAAERLAREQG